MAAKKSKTRRKSLEDVLDELVAVRQAPRAAESVALLRKALAGRSSHAAAKAAQLAGELGIDVVADEMAAAFDRFMTDPGRSDPGCAAKEAIADALQQMAIADTELYLRGIRHRQMEPVWGGSVDTAVSLRGICGIALARVRYAEAVSELAVLLADGEASARRMAAQALAYNGDLAAVPLLRFKVLIGDDEGEVLSEAMRALLELTPAESLTFVASFLDRGAVESESAALALGGARVEGTFELLRDWWQRVREPAIKGTAALALAMLRREESTEMLLSLLAGDSVLDARHALKALSIYRHDDRLRQRACEAIANRPDKTLTKDFAEAFDG